MYFDVKHSSLGSVSKAKLVNRDFLLLLGELRTKPLWVMRRAAEDADCLSSRTHLLEGNISVSI